MSAAPAGAPADVGDAVAAGARGERPALHAAAPATPAATPRAHGTAPEAPPGRRPLRRHLPGGRFGTLSVYVPEGKPTSVAIFLSGDGGWELGVLDMAHALRQFGAVVIGVDIREYFASLRQGGRARPGPAR